MNFGDGNDESKRLSERGIVLPTLSVFYFLSLLFFLFSFILSGCLPLFSFSLSFFFFFMFIFHSASDVACFYVPTI